jgi:hypothetical protein
MAAADRYTEAITCRCGAAVTVCWIDRSYRTADPEIERVTGPAIRRKHKSWGFDKDHTDLLCSRCGSVLHESKAARIISASISSKPAQVKKTIERLYSSSRLAGLHGPEGDLAMAVRSDGHGGGRDQVEVVTIPQVGLDDPPAADDPAVHRRRHGEAPASSRRSRTRL